MIRLFAFLLLGAVTVVGEVSSSTSTVDQTAPVTFNRDVLPILQENCQVCHRPGQIAPMSFMTYESVRPWAKAIKAALLNKTMPPWLADPHFGKFRNAPKLTSEDVATIVSWVDQGAPEGNPTDKPAPVNWVDGWRIPPDVTVSMSAPYKVAPTGSGTIKEFILENPFKQDTWVTSIEIRPGNPSVVHHVVVQLQDQVLTNSAAARTRHCRGEAIVDSARAATRSATYYGDQLSRFERESGCGEFTTMEAVYAPGSQPLDFRYRGSAKKIRAGVPIHLEVHYTPNGKETTDQTSVGFTLAKEDVQRQFVIMAPGHLADTRKTIPAGEGNFTSRGELTFERDVELVWFMPHMHLRGKDMAFRLVFPDGRAETVLNARSNFNWQLGYEVEEPIPVPKGTRLLVLAHHDNSANNPLRPDPSKAVGWGEVTTQEMMVPWFGVLVKGDAEPDMIASYRPGSLDAPIKASQSPGAANPVKTPTNAAPTAGNSDAPRLDESDIGFWIKK